MAKWFRSEPMEYISLIMNEDAAHDCLGDLGKLGVIQFTDVRQSKKCNALVLCSIMLAHVRYNMHLTSMIWSLRVHISTCLTFPFFALRLVFIRLKTE